ncbi:unnamed protein product [Bursaphelenchus xylophilus]|uniref:(pine wood nematode) hypothetical protein n=1 Tax=Bursaphelenchus xylophilus TaxID=6326 RepID=A0A1I7S9B8_BURXY|nr:unnamed protein product [Bursaphelenchus xylophilus]CAG9100507.1 unnamed protein product [Bursaphelenchus xylophilus]
MRITFVIVLLCLLGTLAIAQSPSPRKNVLKSQEMAAYKCQDAKCYQWCRQNGARYGNCRTQRYMDCQCFYRSDHK